MIHSHAYCIFARFPPRFFAFCLFMCIAWHLVCTNASSEGGRAGGVRELLHLKSNMYTYILLFTLFIEIDGIHFSD